MFSFINNHNLLSSNIFKFYNINYIIHYNLFNNENLKILENKIINFNIDNIKHFYLTYSNPIIIPIIAIYPRNNNYINIINELSKYFNTFIIIYSINPSYPIDFNYLNNLSKKNHIHLIDVENIGYDFYKYFIGIKYIFNYIKFDRILLINDSFYFTRPIDDFITYIKFSHKYYNLLGLNNSNEIKLHIQSFILSFDKIICYEFIDYFNKHFKINHSLRNIIDIFEIDFNNFIINNYKTDCFYYITSNNNPYLEPELSNLIKLYNYLIKKIKTI